MSAARKAKIDKLVEYAKTILPKLKQQIEQEMKEEFDNQPILKEIGEKFEVDKNELKKRTRECLILELKTYILREYAANRKTASEYVEICLLRLGLE